MSIYDHIYMNGACVYDRRTGQHAGYCSICKVGPTATGSRLEANEVELDVRLHSVVNETHGCHLLNHKTLPPLSSRPCTGVKKQCNNSNSNKIHMTDTDRQVLQQFKQGVFSIDPKNKKQPTTTTTAMTLAPLPPVTTTTAPKKHPAKSGADRFTRARKRVKQIKEKESKKAKKKRKEDMAELEAELNTVMGGD